MVKKVVLGVAGAEEGSVESAVFCRRPAQKKDWLKEGRDSCA